MLYFYKEKNYTLNISYILDQSIIRSAAKTCQLPDTISKPKRQIKQKLHTKKISYIFQKKIYAQKFFILWDEY